MIKPNHITLFRLFLIFIAFVSWYLVPPQYYLYIGVLFYIAFLLDAVDGWLARTKDLKTDFGKYFDPIVDYIGFLALYVISIEMGILPIWFVFLALTRDFLATFARQILNLNNIVIEANVIAKLKAVYIGYPLVGLYWYKIYGFSSQWLFIVIGLHILLEGRIFGYSDPLENRWNSIILCFATIAVVTLTTLRPVSDSLSDLTVLFILITQSLIWVSGIQYLWDAREYIIQSFESN
ncbi:CDP-alcohol phosphatidyltransferase family protein [Moorena sp. SIO2C4]|uniref:CDP-alcohol phosphatidyltransferase family protein n=2 Tax=unclassified Moorena TaxID=2683338 RepID=UPI0013C93F74|nr:CDP-alcohol phosphatidyltransferase family protein [Moorena sp. SIO2C4]NES41959.1 CDP-alcohol phosphatidyltransferase family protein [Moorena sp. SIO2C4]NES81742.1 CDP-alcohol phosphatidyltransferase family protein [Moorena sp. SIO2B7]